MYNYINANTQKHGDNAEEHFVTFADSVSKKSEDQQKKKEFEKVFNVGSPSRKNR